MAARKFVAYLRVSTDRQGKSGLGLEAQREAVARYLSGCGWKLLAEYIETESGKRNDRGSSRRPFRMPRRWVPPVVAKLDRKPRTAGGDARSLIGIESGSRRHRRPTTSQKRGGREKPPHAKTD
jgi:hypothetical protein